MKPIVNRTRVLFERHRDFWIGALICVAAFVLYLRTMPPTVLDGDSGEFQHMAYYLGVPHSTGYPLYILLAKLFTFFPVGNVAYRVNLFSGACAALTAAFVYAVAWRLIRRRVPAILATLILIVTPSMWGAAVDAEVYALHLLLGVLAIFFALRWHQEGRRRDFYLLAFVFGLGLTHHLVIAFIAPALARLVWLHRARLSLPTLARGAMLVLLPLLLYAYIPIRANQLIAQQDPANWDFYKREDAMLKGTVTAYYNNTLEGFFSLVTGFGNRHKLGFKSPLDEANRLNLAVTLLLQQFGIAGIAFAIVGAGESFKRNRQVFLFLLTAGVGVGFIAIYLRGMSTVYYFSIVYFVLALWIGFGLEALLRWSRALADVSQRHRTDDLERREHARAERIRSTTTLPRVRLSASPLVVSAVLLLLPASALVVNFPALDQSDYYTARDYAQAVLRDHIAKNAVVIAPWEVSEPIRYYQFVEKQRPDLLVVNVSPIWPQFEKMLTRARELKRPFYFVEFNPELRTSSGPRTVQAIPLPLLEEPQPRYSLPNARVVPEAQVIGYDLDPDPPQPGKPARVLIYYRTLARMYPMYSARLTLNDVTGKTWGEYSGFPATFYYRTYQWQEGDYDRDAWSLNLPTDAPSGLYNLELSWSVYDLDTRKSDYDHEKKISLGVIRVGDFAVGEIARAQNARVGDAITFLGWNAQPAPNGNTVFIARGQSLSLDLFWRADHALQEAYTVFVHLVDASGRVVADADSPPYRGMFPTDRWTIGEVVRDRHTLAMPANLALGDYSIEIGMYVPATGARLPIEAASDRADKIVLTQVKVR